VQHSFGIHNIQTTATTKNGTIMALLKIDMLQKFDRPINYYNNNSNCMLYCIVLY